MCECPELTIQHFAIAQKMCDTHLSRNMTPYLPLTPEYVLVLSAIGVVFIVLLVWNIRLEIRLAKMRYGKNAHRLDESMSNIQNHLGSLEESKDAIIKHLGTVEKRLKKSVQSVETVRFNPFKGTGSGGSQSFASVFLNENGDGVVISSLYSRDRVSVFSKPISQFKPAFDLSEEESKVLEKARKSL